MVVTVTLAAAWTLLPAVLAALGPRVERGSLPRRWQPADARSDIVLSDVPALQQIGFALAVAIALDATLVRLVLVPALMRLFG